MSYSHLLDDIREYIEYGGRHDRVLVVIKDSSILATGIGRHDDGLTLEFNSHKFMDFFKRRVFDSFCITNNIAQLKRWKTPECTTQRAELPSNEYEIVKILKEYFKVVHKLENDYEIQIHKRVWQ